MERADRSVSIPDRIGGGRIHFGIVGTRVPGGGRQADVSPRAAHRAGVPAGGADAVAIAPGASGAFVRDVSHTPHDVGDGDVWVRLPLVPDGGTRTRNMARLP